jgi:hypothetical protein
MLLAFCTNDLRGTRVLGLQRLEVMRRSDARSGEPFRRRSFHGLGPRAPARFNIRPAVRQSWVTQGAGAVRSGLRP